LLLPLRHFIGCVFFISLFEQMDDVVNTGQIPFSLIRWQMTGLSDEVDRLLPPPGQLSLVPLE
jgi:hypothetical protein